MMEVGYDDEEIDLDNVCAWTYIDGIDFERGK